MVALPSPPVVRSVLLCLAFGLGRSCSAGRSTRCNCCRVSVLAMLVYHPLDLYNAGFQLSFGTVLGLMLFTRPVLQFLRRVATTADLEIARSLSDSRRRVDRSRAWIDNSVIGTLAAGLVAWRVSMPLIAFHFEQLNPWADPRRHPPGAVRVRCRWSAGC